MVTELKDIKLWIKVIKMNKLDKDDELCQKITENILERFQEKTIEHDITEIQAIIIALNFITAIMSTTDQDPRILVKYINKTLVDMVELNRDGKVH